MLFVNHEFDSFKNRYFDSKKNQDNLDGGVLGETSGCIITLCTCSSDAFMLG